MPNKHGLLLLYLHNIRCPEDIAHVILLYYVSQWLAYKNKGIGNGKVDDGKGSPVSWIEDRSSCGRQALCGTQSDQDRSDCREGRVESESPYRIRDSRGLARSLGRFGRRKSGPRASHNRKDAQDQLNKRNKYMN